MSRMISAFCLIVAVVFASGSPTPVVSDERQSRCPGGYAHGQTAEISRYWYQCNDGQLVPKGCLDESHRRVDIWNMFDDKSGNYRMQCVVDNDGYLTVNYKACVDKGVERAAGEQWKDDKYYYTCRRSGEYLTVDVSGCVHKGTRVEIDERVAEGDFVFQCRRSANGTCSMCPVACRSQGRDVSIGESFEKDQFWYTCTSDGKGLRVVCVGCVNQGQRLKDGDRYFERDIIFECTIRTGNASRRVVGCLQRDGTAITERAIGCYWVEGQAPLQYEMTCKSDQAGGASRVPYRCTYNVNRGSYAIEPGCYDVVGDEAVGCLQQQSTNGQSLLLRPVPVEQIAELTSAGLRRCT